MRWPAVYALGFAAYLGYTLGEFGVHSMAGLPVEGAIFEKGLAAVIALRFIAINFKGVPETGLAGNIVTVAKITPSGGANVRPDEQSPASKDPAPS